MKKLLLASVAAVALAAAGSADAADLGTRPVYKAPPIAAPVPVFSWTGCYIGAHIGGGWGRKEFSDPADPNIPSSSTTTGATLFFVGWLSPGSLQVDPSGVLGGGQVGCDYQFAPNWVVGIEGEGSGADIRGSALDPLFPPPTFNKTFHAKTDWLASVTARVGWTWDRWMLYGKGGVAWAGDKYHVDEIKSSTNFTYDASETRTGWTVGVGLAWAFWQNWSAFLEYNFYGFGRRDVFFPCNQVGVGSCGVDGPVHVKQDINAVKFGINYLFGWGKAPAPVVARY
jgi:outer membrane immunogenic protein